MATFTLQLRHEQERARAAEIQAEIALAATQPAPEDAGGDHRHRIPTIGLNSGHMPGTRPDAADCRIWQVTRPTF